MVLNRRRFLALTAAGCLPWRAGLAQEPVRWRGDALGAAASLTLFGPDPATGRRLVAECLAEMDRLEGIFSLYRDDSAVVRLNRQARLETPPVELVQVLSISRHLSALSHGAFDVTVQPLWDLYASHFRQAGADPRGPAESTLSAARRLVDWRGITVAAERIAFDRAGMAVTLNGIAHGYVADQVAGLLRRRGLRHVLADMGEIRALGRRPDGTPWRVGLEGGGEVRLADQAVATSSPGGTRFSPWCNHIFDPASGGCSQLAGSVSVVAPTAILADALSTAFAVRGKSLADAIAAAMPGVRIIWQS